MAASLTQRTIAAGAAAAIALAAVWWFSGRHAAPDMGVALSLARERAGRVSAVRYAVTFRVPRSRAMPVTGRIGISFVLADASRPLALDFHGPATAIDEIVTGGGPISTLVTNEHLIVPVSALVAGENHLEIVFTAGNEPLNRHDDFLYSLFVPARASEVFPCFDQPDLKARWSLTLEIPNDWVAASNGRESGRVVTGDRLGLQYEETEPIPTYLFAFVAGRFAVETAERAGRSFRLFHRETDQARLERNRDAIFDLHAAALDWLESYTGTPYAFGKFDLVLIPSFQFSGMEHPGAVYYNASSVLLEPSATQNQLLNRASLIAHETAHMWFGNLVTMRWFDDVWLKEVFANLMAAKIVIPMFPRLNHDLRFLLQHLPPAYDVDRTAGANPIRQELRNLDDAGSLYGAIIYQKAPVVMRQLESLLGADRFREGLREYLTAHRHATASWDDLLTHLDTRTPLDLRAWSRAWVDQPGRPTIRTELALDHGKIGRLAFSQEDSRARSLVWPQPLRVLIGSAGVVRTFDVLLNGRDVAVPEAVGLPTPAWVLPMGRGIEYGFFDPDPATLTYLTSHLRDLPDPLARGAALVVVWDAMLERRVESATVFRMLVNAIAVESDELNVQQMLDQIRTSFWRFTGPDERHAVAATLEPVLRRGLERAPSTSLKGAWFTTLRAVALTTPTLAWLESIWHRDRTIPGLPLTEIDEADLALELAVRDVPRAADVLEAQRQRLMNPDRRARFEFLMPAVSSDASRRGEFFSRLRDRTFRSREAWVVESLRLLHHPLRAAQSRQYVRPSLGLLPEIHRTGDIFFPKRWADAVLSGYQSVQTAAEVRNFIDTLPPDYPQRLRWVLLSAADPLFRAARFQQQ